MMALAKKQRIKKSLYIISGIILVSSMMILVIMDPRIMTDALKGSSWNYDARDPGEYELKLFLLFSIILLFLTGIGYTLLGMNKLKTNKLSDFSLLSMVSGTIVIVISLIIKPTHPTVEWAKQYSSLFAGAIHSGALLIIISIILLILSIIKNILTKRSEI